MEVKGKNFQKFNDYFKQQNVFAETDNKKHKISKKSLIQLLSDQNEAKRPSTHNEKRQNLTRPSTQSTHFNKFRKAKSVQLSKIPSASTTTIKRMHSTVITRPTGSASSQKRSHSP